VYDSGNLSELPQNLAGPLNSKLGGGVSNLVDAEILKY
jgi:hypothetical protein